MTSKVTGKVRRNLGTALWKVVRDTTLDCRDPFVSRDFHPRINNNA